MKRLKFRFHNKQKLAEFVWDLRNSFPKENLSERNNNPCIYINFSRGLIKDMLNSEELTPTLKNKIAKEIKISKEDIKIIRQFSKNLEDYWNKKVNNCFFNEMGKIFGYKYLQKEYICYPTNKITGSYFGKNEITSVVNNKYKNNELNEIEFASVVIAEEILHLIYWKLWQEIYNKKITNIDEIFGLEGPEWSCWHIAEIMPEYLLINNPKFNEFRWNKDNRSSGYTWIPKLKKILDPIWNNSRNIGDFVINAHNRVGINIK